MASSIGLATFFAALVLLLNFCHSLRIAPDSYSDSESSEEFLQWHDVTLQNSEGRDERYTYKSVCFENGRLELIEGWECHRLVALGRFRNQINVTGWSYLEIETKPNADDDAQAYAAGFVEGVLTRRILGYHLTNKVNGYCAGFEGYCAKLKAYFTKNLQYIKDRIEKAHPDDIYWQAVKRSFLQLTGLWDGYRNISGINPRILYEFHPLLLLNAKGELYDLEKKFNKTKDPVLDGDFGSCSGLIKVAPNNADIFISQVTMSGFQNMIRVLKLYKFGYDQALFPGHTTTFSSYPGMLYSSDDFALISSGLAVIETTISIFNASLFDNIQPYGQLHCWVRAIVSNMLARTAREWCKLFSRHNSGTYNNQWSVLDYKRFKPHKELPNYGLLYVLEQTPGLAKFKDMSSYLKSKTYFASYNIPFFKSISRISGFDEKAKEMSWFSWSDCPRAKMFGRDHQSVKDLDSLTRLMRYNDYKHDEFSRCDCNPPYTAEAAISSRGDLNPANGTYPFPGMGHVNHGALDYKGTNYELQKQLRFRAWSGPPYDQVPVFRWSTFDFAANVSHVGHPDEWAFKFVEYKWETDVSVR